ncbi:MAG TPA: LLM class flavin-dependent oxidoreductase [Acidimicrobiia bacterium]|nr:LLM class flavin-dependent oxidoreductase [Acidimicrobiia bacterium]
MKRGFGIDASVPMDVATEIARRVEAAGYDSFWVNGSPHDGALGIIEAALGATGLDVGVGVFPLTKISAPELVDEVERRGLPQPRLHLGIGSGRRPGALDEVRAAAALLKEKLEVRVVAGAVGPKMLALAGEVADEVILTWSFVSEVNRALPIIKDGAARAGREVPTLISFVRCGLLPQAAEAVAERAGVYDQIPWYHEVFERNGVTAADTVVTGTSREELIEGIEREESVLDVSVIRAIAAANTVEALGELVDSCAP